VARAEDRALLRSNPSAAPGIKTEERTTNIVLSSFLLFLGIGTKRKTSGGLGDWSPIQERRQAFGLAFIHSKPSLATHRFC